MTRPEPIIRPATAADLAAFYPGRAMPSFRGVAVELDGEVVGIGGVCYQKGRPVAASDIRGALRKHKRTLVKVSRMLANLYDQIGGTVYAVACPTEPTAPYLLAKLGFKPTGMFCPTGEVLERRAHG